MSSRDGHPQASPPMIWSGETPAPVPAYVHPATYSTAPPPLPPAMSRGFDFLGLLKALKRHWVLALTLSLLLPAIAGAVAWKLMPPARYTARAQIRVKSATPTLMDSGNEFGNINEIKQFQKTQQALIKGTGIIKGVLQSPKIADLTLVKAQTDPHTWLENELQVTFTGEVMSISLSGEYPGHTAKVVNAVTDEYLAKHVNSEKFRRTKELEAADEVYTNYKKLLEERRTKLKGLAESAGTNDPETMRLKQQVAMSLEADVQQKHLEAKTERGKAELQYNMLRERQNPTADPAQVTAATEALIARDPVIAGLDAKITELQGHTNKVRGVVRNPLNEPLTRTTGRQLEDLKQQRQAQVAKIRPKIEQEVLQSALAGGRQNELATAADNLEFWKRYEAVTAEQVESIAKNMNETVKNSGDLERLQEEIDNYLATTRKFSQQVEQLRAEVQAPPRIELIDYAPTPKARDIKRRVLAGSAAALGTLALILFGISWLEYRVRRIGSVDEVSQGLGLRLVGALPATPVRSRLALAGRHELQEANWRSRLNESVNAIRTLMLRQSQLERLQVVMVTSATVGEGKTSLACHLATSLARTGRKTLLLDCDLRNPTAHRVFDLTLEPGLSEILRGETTVDDAFHSISNVGDLRMITAGRCDTKALHALGLEQMREVFDTLRQQYDFIVVDTPPVLPVADTLLLGQHVDASLFSILRDVSRIPRVHAACERLSALGIRILGAVVAGTPIETHGSEYHYTSYAGVPVGSKENA